MEEQGEVGGEAVFYVGEGKLGGVVNCEIHQ